MRKAQCTQKHSGSLGIWVKIRIIVRSNWEPRPSSLPQMFIWMPHMHASFDESQSILPFPAAGKIFVCICGALVLSHRVLLTASLTDTDSCITPRWWLRKVWLASSHTCCCLHVAYLLFRCVCVCGGVFLWLLMRAACDIDFWCWRELSNENQPDSDVLLMVLKSSLLKQTNKQKMQTHLIFFYWINSFLVKSLKSWPCLTFDKWTET